MKGQYLAVETVFTFGLGLMVAIGVITLFHEYRMGVMDDAEPDQVEMVASKIASGMNALKEVDETENGSGRYQVDLPETISGRSYSMRLDGSELVLRVGREPYRKNLVGFSNYDLIGGASGGDITVFKEKNQFELRVR